MRSGHATIICMGYRLAQFVLLILGLVFAFAALDAFSEPWRTMNGAIAAETACGHLLGLVLSVICFRTSMYAGGKAVYGNGKRAPEPDL